MARITLNNVSIQGIWPSELATASAAPAPLFAYTNPITLSSARATSGPNNSAPTTGSTPQETYNYFNNTGQTGAYNAMIAATYIKIPGATGYVFFTVPETGTWRIKAQGGSGGPTTKATKVGAAVQGDFLLNKGDVLWITIGLAGASGNTALTDLAGGAGGGATFVAKSSTGSSTFASGDMTLLLCAAGGYGQPEARHAGVAGNSSSANGTTGTGYTNNWLVQSINGQSSGFGGQLTYGGFGGGNGTDDSYGPAGGYDGMFSVAVNSFVNASATNIVREDAGTLVTTWTNGAVRLTKL